MRDEVTGPRDTSKFSYLVAFLLNPDRRADGWRGGARKLAFMYLLCLLGSITSQRHGTMEYNN